MAGHADQHKKPPACYLRTGKRCRSIQEAAALLPQDRKAMLINTRSCCPATSGQESHADRYKQPPLRTEKPCILRTDKAGDLANNTLPIWPQDKSQSACPATHTWLHGSLPRANLTKLFSSREHHRLTPVLVCQMLRSFSQRSSFTARSAPVCNRCS